MRKLVALALALGTLGGLPGRAAAKGDEDEEEEEATDEEEAEPEPEPEKPEKPAKPKAEPEFRKQDLSGHDLGNARKSNIFENDLFFVDKLDTEKTEKKTLVQGSLTSTSFAYGEKGGAAQPAAVGGVPSASEYLRLFTDLRLQTDFRHISGGKWDARVDARGRFTANPGTNTPNYVPPTDSASQSGFLGENELELRELWIARSGKRSDLFIGRQFVPDLAGIKFDGLRVDYAKSSKFTLLAFGGLYPIRGSRSITTDYLPLRTQPDGDLNRAKAGRLVGAGGFGAAYRTQNAYGAFGGVVLAPFASEAPRIFATSTGYWRSGPKLDVYHFAVIDAIGSNPGITNLSAGLNYKPDQRLRGTLSFNRVDTETLNVQAQAFLSDIDAAINIIQNEAFLIRVAQNQARASLSAGLGQLQRFEITAAATVRYRQGITLVAPAPPMGVPAATFSLPAGKSLEVYGGITDRRSIAKLRIGVDGSRILRLGNATYQRTTALAFRAFAGRELKNGHGEWEAEVSYSNTKDDNAGKVCSDVVSCYGAAKSTVISAGGNMYYRLNRDWYGMAGLFLSRQTLTSFNGVLAAPADGPVTGVSGFFRAAYRF